VETKNNMKLELTVVVYGAKNRRVGVEMRPTIPSAIGGDHKAVTSHQMG